MLIGNRPLVVEPADDASDEEKAAAKEPVKAFALKLLEEKYGITEEDFLSAEIEVVPAGRARELGFDRSMVIGYGQDDRVCAYTSLEAQLAIETPKKPPLPCWLTKGRNRQRWRNGHGIPILREHHCRNCRTYWIGKPPWRCVAFGCIAMLSSDVSAGFDPAYASVFETKNAAYLGKGLVFNKYTGARGKSGSNDARAEYVAAYAA